MQIQEAQSKKKKVHLGYHIQTAKNQRENFERSQRRENILPMEEQG